jgi:hypothetical protein
MKYFILTLLLLVSTGSYAYADSEPCDERNIASEVQLMYRDLPDTEEGQKMLSIIDGKIKSGDIEEVEAKALLLVHIEVILRQKNYCKLHNELKERVADSFLLDKKDEINRDNVQNESGLNECPAELYAGDATERYLLEKTNATYPAFEKQVYDHITAQTPEATVNVFDKKWQQPDERTRVMISVFDVGLRQENNCENAALPLSNIILEMIK